MRAISNIANVLKKPADVLKKQFIPSTTGGLETAQRL